MEGNSGQDMGGPAGMSAQEAFDWANLGQAVILALHLLFSIGEAGAPLLLFLLRHTLNSIVFLEVRPAGGSTKV